ncbi:MAG: MetQ/NlpA family ABC transporter substrate-binding protein [Eubacteriales bacterium]|nr:MetQ/NlpA family ABC transporter substrate-binding protein [Eubacteriales bacterium]
MRKRSIAFLFALVLALSVTACKDNNTATGDSYNQNQTANTAVMTLTVGATPVPHAEILEVVKPMLEKEGVKLEVKEFTDYVLPNTSLNEKQIDANFFQHVPYMEKFNAENNMNLVSVAKVHVEPMGAYSQKIKSVNEIADNATVAIPNDPTNEGRALLLLQAQGLIKLKDAADLNQTPKDIVENPKNLKFQELEAATLPRALQDVDFAVINTNYALVANLNPTKDALFMEGGESAYANILTTREDNKDSDAVQKLIKALQSEEVKKFIESKYEGAVVPAF